jgi:NAD(P)-dependent dehydrogenase (short-subunit alcohol dehydrogenase family)
MDDMVAFITGAGSGIGQAAAKLLARRGARVALAGRTPDQLAEVAEAIGGDQRHRDLDRWCPIPASRLRCTRAFGRKQTCIGQTVPLNANATATSRATPSQ